MNYINVDNLKPGMIAAEDIYAVGLRNSPIIRSGTILNKAIIAALKQRRVDGILISIQQEPSSEVADIKPQIALPVQHVVDKPKPTVLPELRDDAVGTLQHVFEFLSINNNFERFAVPETLLHIDNIVESLVESLSSDKASIVNLHSLKSPDDYIYHHSLSVTVIAVAVGKHLGFDKKRLCELGKCSMLHDIGKVAVPVEIICKPARLSHNELSVMRHHSLAGYQYLLNTNIGSDDVLKGVLHHHERCDGRGYPYGFKGDEIPVFSRIIAVADVYDALTSSRPYRGSMQPSEAIEYIMGSIGTAFDYDAVDSFIRKLEIYPIGSYLLLSNGTIGAVVNNEIQMRPTVKLVNTGEIVDLAQDRSRLNIVIERILSDELLELC